ncbi:hypothetical protein AMAG_18117 [Allomyces macrogynus ATCC 38327]|uniref:Uncharacterized protein n=1 Tax=Allomyces macrogynus (strain ATCC 38327) TaxID=578462 RepID=A0A0L0S9V4_ALLM3|nr:hypothetical protein AMAG_18117 [Allomyces macrogynus ATCC 38327]|eukprot:KNE59169.1 hypothetical protein AMAG_18117 [Allomyces macrogynus ATCC 38327]
MAALSPKRMSRKLVAGITYPHDAVTSNLMSASTLMAWRAFLTVVFLAVLVLAMMSAYLGYRFTRATAVQHDMDVSNVTATIHSLLYTFNCTNHPIVVIVYWIFLSDNFTKSTSTPGRFVSVFMHGVTLVIVLLEISGDAWVYSFLDYTKPAAAYMYPGVLVAAIVFFAIMLMVHRIRDAIVGRPDGYEANKDVELSASRLNASDNV